MIEEPVVVIDSHGTKLWYLKSRGVGYAHRLDGPAFERIDGYIEWWMYGVNVTEEIEK